MRVPVDRTGRCGRSGGCARSRSFGRWGQRSGHWCRRSGSQGWDFGSKLWRRRRSVHLLFSAFVLITVIINVTLHQTVIAYHHHPRWREEEGTRLFSHVWRHINVHKQTFRSKYEHINTVNLFRHTHPYTHAHMHTNTLLQQIAGMWSVTRSWALALPPVL